MLGYFVYKKRDLPFNYLFGMFAAFIIFCGCGHLLESLTYYSPMYRLSGFWKLLTAIISIATAISLIPLFPKILNFTNIFFSVVCSAPDGIVVTNRSGKIILFNNKFNKITEHDISELQDKSIHELIPGLDKEIIERPLESIIINKKNAVIPLEVNSNTTTMGQQQIYTYIIREISERKKIEKAFEAIFQKCNFGIALVNIENKFVEVNPIFSGIFGYAPSELLQMSFNQLLHTENKNKNIFRKLTPENNRYELPEERYIHKDGSVIWAEISVSIFTKIPESTLSIITIKDITEKKKKENDLDKNIKTLDTIFNYTFQFIILIKADGTIIAINKTALDFLKMQLYTLENQNFLDLSWWSNPQEKEQMRMLVQSITHSSNKCVTNEFVLCNDRETITVDLSLKPFFYGQKEAHFILVEAHDISDYKQIQEELQKAMEKAEEASIAKGSFLANMSHEIRTPMNGIMGFIELLLRSNLNHEQYDYVTKMKKVSKSLLGILNDILDFSKIEAGKLQIEKIPFNLEEILDEITDQFSKIAFDKNLLFLIDIELGLPIHLIGDPLRIRQILINLVSNAIKFTEKGEVILKIEKQTKNDKTYFCFFVRDTGIGMPQESVEKLFLPFNQLEDSNTRKYGGTGLGLSICHKLINLMDGALSVESIPYEGSTFSFQIPLKKEKPRKVAIRENRMQGLTVLIIDDQKKHQQILKRMMEYFGFCCQCIENLGDLKNLEKQDVKIIISNWKVKEIEGLNLIETINSYTHLTNIPLVIMANFIQNDEMLSECKSNVYAFIEKPVKMSLLFEITSGVFGKFPGRKHTTKRVWTGENPKNLEEMKILLVEDNEINQQIAKELLQTAKIKVTIAENGKQALQKLQKNSFDLVLMDIQMPIMNGYEATQAIRKESQWQNLPIVAMTAYAMSYDKEKCLQAGMDDYISKPIDPERLFHVLMKWLITKKIDYNFSPTTTKNNEVKFSVPSVVFNQENLGLVIPNIHVKKALNRVGNNRDFFVKLLGKFVAEYESADEKVSSALNDKNYILVKQFLHTLKGVSGNIGAVNLQNSILPLEQFITKILEENENENENDNKEKTLEYFDKFCLTLKQTIISIKKADLDIKKTTKRIKGIHNQIMSMEKINEEFADVDTLLDELELNIKKFVPQKIYNTIKKLRMICNNEIKIDLEILENMVKKYKFKEAKELCQKISQNMRKKNG